MFPTVHGVASQAGQGGAPSPAPELPFDPDGIWLESLFIGQPTGTDVSLWEDASAEGYDLSAGLTPPTLYVPAIGAPTVRGGGTRLLRGAGAFYDTNTEPFTAYLVTSSPPVRSDSVIASIRPNSGNPWSWWWNPGALPFFRSGMGVGDLKFGSNLDDTTLRVLSIRFDPSESGIDRFRAYVAKALVDQQNVATVEASSHALSLLGESDGTTETRRFHGEVAALLWYRSALGDSDHESVIDYLTSRYVTPQIPETHFRHYRLWITARDGGSYTTIRELTLHETLDGANFAVGGDKTGASSNSVFSGTYPASAAFDGNPASQWFSAVGGLPHWIRVDFSNPHPLAKYTIMGDSAGSPASWTLEGSNDGLYWTPLDTVTGETGWSANEVREFFI